MYCKSAPSSIPSCEIMLNLTPSDFSYSGNRLKTKDGFLAITRADGEC